MVKLETSFCIRSDKPAYIDDFPCVFELDNLELIHEFIKITKEDTWITMALDDIPIMSDKSKMNITFSNIYVWPIHILFWLILSILTHLSDNNLNVKMLIFYKYVLFNHTRTMIIVPKILLEGWSSTSYLFSILV